LALLASPSPREFLAQHPEAVLFPGALQIVKEPLRNKEPRNNAHLSAGNTIMPEFLEKSRK
jgi:hypothetical protein